ncbi:alpha/beta hydrolase [soil metagenome]
MEAIAITLLLWSGPTPHAVGTSEIDKPKVHVYQAAKPTGGGVVICPGGGYGHLAMDHEGKQVAEFFNKLGITAFVLQYRIATKERPGPLHPAPLLDAQRAIRLMRSKAEELKIDPKKVGLIGFSAGGHLASTAGTHFDDGDKDAKDPVDKFSCRPDFLMLGYPVITMEPGVTHNGTKKNLLGDKPDEKLVELYSNEKQVTEKTPPTFIFHTSEDAGVVPENAVRFYLALKKAKVPVELHMYEKGRHGVGMYPKTGTPTDQWGERLAEWLKVREIVK